MPYVGGRLIRLFAAAAIAMVACSLAADAGVDGPLATTLYVRPAGGEERLISEIARAASLPIGCEVSSEPQRERVGSSTLPSRTFRQALNDWMRLDPRYEQRDVGGIAVVRPRRAWGDRRDVLNQRVGPIEWRDVNRLEFLLRVTGLVGQRLDDDAARRDLGPRFSVVITGGSVLDVLNAGTRAAGTFAWVVESSAENIRVTALPYAPDSDGGLSRLSVRVRR